ncbi:MAG TPA: hypothetical protein PLW35_06055, partial [Verrucomicrobiota bacterium]|nr:hypothetical protein [Verrucomicrobiota bacterium]
MKAFFKSICYFILMAGVATSASAAETQEPLGWRLGVASWSFNRFTLFDAIERTAVIGLKYIEAFEGQQLEPGSETKLDVNMPNAAIDRLHARLRSANVRLVSIYIHELSTNEIECRKSFEFARKLGVETIVSEP